MTPGPKAAPSRTAVVDGLKKKSFFIHRIVLTVCIPLMSVENKM